MGWMIAMTTGPHLAIAASPKAKVTPSSVSSKQGSLHHRPTGWMQRLRRWVPPWRKAGNSAHSTALQTAKFTASRRPASHTMGAELASATIAFLDSLGLGIENVELTVRRHGSGWTAQVEDGERELSPRLIEAMEPFLPLDIDAATLRSEDSGATGRRAWFLEWEE
jgi:hypothetical protein